MSGRVVFSGHAVRRMMERGLSKDGVLSVLDQGEVIADYPDDTPFPSVLLLGDVDGKPVHVVAARDKNTGDRYVITAYVPGLNVWQPGFRRRRNP